ncbi:hypothetical protein QQ054_01965 [Oscillatoria amoena NRMC-F 0135]|nr:hypothetical protein [Oscillatoria amoena NRMC-F 0135]
MPGQFASKARNGLVEDRNGGGEKANAIAISPEACDGETRAKKTLGEDRELVP